MPSNDASIAASQGLHAGLQLHGAGRLGEAEALYRQVLEGDPGNADAIHMLGVLAFQRGEHQAALDLLERARLQGLESPLMYNNLGNVLGALGRPEAGSAYRRAIELQPDLVEAHYNLGLMLEAGGNSESAVASFRDAIALRPDHDGAHYSLGVALQRLGRLEQAIASYRSALAAKPDRADAHYCLGAGLQEMGSVEAAIASYRSAVSIAPGFVLAHCSLLQVLSACAVASGSSEALDRHLRQLIEQDKGLFEAAVNGVLEWHEWTLPEDACLLASRAHAVVPGDLRIWRHWIGTMPNLESFAPAEIAVRSAEWTRSFVAGDTGARAGAHPVPVRGGRVRVGYVASRLHLMMLVTHMRLHDFERFEILVFTDDPRCTQDMFGPDVRLLALGAGDPTDRLRSAHLDIAIDMGGPGFGTGWPGIDAFAAFTRRIAPVQCHWICTTASYGPASQYDYVLADEYLIPQSLETLYSEEPKRLKDVVHCWRPPDEDAPSDPPFLGKGHITFGSANGGRKLSMAQLRRWARAVAAVPGSAMIVKGVHARNPLFRQRALDVFEDHGIRDRLAFSDFTPFQKNPGDPRFPGEFYAQVDISLDTYPYAGALTTLESLWYGVPVITRRGDGFNSRQAADYLQLIGRDGWICDNDEEYVDIAVRTAADPGALVAARKTLRAEVAASPLLDGPRFARSLENAFLEMLAERGVR